MQWRTRWRELAAVALIAGAVGGLAVAAIAGGRRTSTAQSRLLEVVDGVGDVRILNVGTADVEAIVRLPQVRKYAVAAFPVLDTPVEVTATTDQLHGAQLVRGELDPHDPLAAALDQSAAVLLGLDVGDRVDLAFYTAEQYATLDPSGGPEGPAVSVRVAAIVREPDDVNAADPAAVEMSGSDASLALPQSFLDRYGDEIGFFNEHFVSVELDGGPAGVGPFVDAVRALPGGNSVEFIEPGGVDPATDSAIELQSRALLFFGLAVVLGGVLAVAQMIARQIRAAATDEPTLRALGMTRAQRLIVATVRGALTGLGAGVVAVIVAYALSPLTPIGVARAAEPHPGFDANISILAIAFVAITSTIVALSALGAVVTRRDIEGRMAGAVEHAPAHPSVVGALSAHAGAAPTVRAAASMAFGTRSSRLSSRATVVAVDAAAIVAVGALVVLASLHDVVNDPQRFGWTFDAVAGNLYQEEQGDLFELVADTPGVEAYVPALSMSVRIDGRDINALGVAADQRIALATLRAGRLPSGPDEIAVGARTLDALGKHLGETVELDAGTVPQQMTVTGEVVVPEVGGGRGLGEGAVMRLHDLQSLFPGRTPNLALLDLDPERAREAMASIREQSSGTQSVVGPFLPTRLYSYERVSRLPVIVAGLVALLAVATLVHHLVVLGRVRRRDVAILKSLGFTRRQIASTSAIQASAFAAAGALIGVPLGIAAGRAVWATIATQLGLTSDRASVPLLPVLAIALATVVVANAAAALPGWRTARTAPAPQLRTD